MEAHGSINLTRKEPTASASASSSEGGDHDDDLTKRNDKKQEFPATKPPSTAQEEEKAAAQPSGAGEKKKKEKRKRVVRDRKAQELIDVMIVNSASVYEIPDERLARCSEEDRAKYAERKSLRDKWIAYEQDLIDQYLINGYAETVWEAIDDDEDDGGGDTVEIDGSKEG